MEVKEILHLFWAALSYLCRGPQATSAIREVFMRKCEKH